MRDIYPLSERFDLRYVRTRHFPDTWTRAGALIVALGVGAYVAAREWSGDHTLFSSGPLTGAHAMFADDCAQCHQPEAGASVAGVGAIARNYWLAPQDSACLRCHVAPLHAESQARYVGLHHAGAGPASPLMASDCRSCHVEHRGAEASLTAVADRFCTQCHADLQRTGRAVTPVAVFGRGHGERRKEGAK